MLIFICIKESTLNHNKNAFLCFLSIVSSISEIQGKMSAISEDVNRYNFPRSSSVNIYQKSLKYVLWLHDNYVLIKLKNVLCLLNIFLMKNKSWEKGPPAKMCTLTPAWEHLPKEDLLIHYEVLLSDQPYQFA